MLVQFKFFSDSKEIAPQNTEPLENSIYNFKYYTYHGLAIKMVYVFHNIEVSMTHWGPKILPQFIIIGSTDDKWSLIQIMAWLEACDMALSEPTMV